MNLDHLDWRSLALRHRFRLVPMARAVGVSVRSVQRVFLRLYGGTVRAQFKVWRREHATELLRANRFRIKEVGHAVGYVNCSTFSRACHDWTGCTPKQLEARVLS